MECQCALIKTLFDYCPREGRVWWPSTAQIGTKLLYMPSPEPVVYIVLIHTVHTGVLLHAYRFLDVLSCAYLYVCAYLVYILYVS